MKTPPPDDSDPIARLADEVAKLNRHRFVRTNNSMWRLISFQFIRGLSFGLGSVVGATLLVSLIAWWMAQFQFLPIIGQWAAQLERYIELAR